MSADVAKTRPKKRPLLTGIGCGTLAIGALVAWTWVMCERDAGVVRAGEAFLADIRRGDVAAAYSRLSARRRAVMSAEAFDELTRHPAFRAHDSATIGQVEQKHPGFCTRANVEVAGREWAAQLFYVEEEGGYRVHSFAIQAPAIMQLGTLLPECGLWEGTFAGYSGPPIERATTPMDL
ncbi:MAG: hypothetical protein HYY06_33380 [Deltaproteobacteria bacterium]|nr:hypothetical protein [Deltaproteobacteria bacterium]